MRRAIAAISALSCALLAAPAWAGSGDAVIRDCAQHGKLTKTYTQAQYADALANLPADLDEYSNCRQVISAAKRKASLGGTTGTTGGGGTPSGGGTSSGGGSPPSPDSSTPGSPTGPPVFNGGGANAPAGGSAGGGGATPSQSNRGAAASGPDLSQQQANADAAAQQGAPGRANLDLTGVTPATAAASRTGAGALPTPVLVALIVLVVAALAALAWVARRRLPALADLSRLRRVLPRRGA